MNSDGNTNHQWKFFTAGGALQVSINSGSDIEALANLDPKLWTALSSPSKNLRFDQKTLSDLDTDNDGRIRTPEIINTSKWLSLRFKNLDGFFSESSVTPLDELRTDTEEGKALYSSVMRILRDLDKSNEISITIDQAENAESVFNASAFNGDGIITPASTDNESLRSLIEEIIACCGSEIDRSGNAGINQAIVDKFFNSVAARRQWLSSLDSSMLPLSDCTAAACSATEAVATKINDFFTRCSLIAYDGKLSAALNSDESEIAAIASSAITGKENNLEELPLALVSENANLPLFNKVNPYWADALENFARCAVKPVFGDIDELSFAQWRQIYDSFAAYRSWLAAEEGQDVSSLDTVRLDELLVSDSALQLKNLIEQDESVTEEHRAFADVSKALRLRKNFVQFLRNYVNMIELYNPDSSPIYRVGSLYIDSRTVQLCFEVENLAEFQKLAATSKCCLVYCTLKRDTSAPRMICGVVTAGVAQNLWIGRNGVFYDLDGSDWEATIVKVDSHDISLREAFWSPWRKIGGMISQQVNKLLASKQDSALGNISTKIEKSAKSAGTGAIEPPKKVDGAALASSVAALGIAVGMVGAAIGGLLSAIAGIPLWKTAIGLIVAILAVSTPSVIITWFNLRSRNIAPILNASGWAINRPLKFSFKLAAIWTCLAKIPERSVVSHTDPFADRNHWRGIIAMAVIIAAAIAGYFVWNSGIADSLLPEKLRKNYCAQKTVATETQPAQSAAPVNGN